MKFRTHIAVTLIAAAVIPMAAASYWMYKDAWGRINDADVDQQRETLYAASLIVDRLKELSDISRIADRMLVKPVIASDSLLIQEALRDIVDSFLLLNNLHVDVLNWEDKTARVIGFQPTDNQLIDRFSDPHDTRWHARHIFANPDLSSDAVELSPVILSSEPNPVPLLTFVSPLAGNNFAEKESGRTYLVSGAIALDSLFSDIDSTLSGSKFSLFVVDERGQIIWPYRSESQIQQWPTGGVDSSFVNFENERYFTTEVRLETHITDVRLPDWRIFVGRPAASRTVWIRALEHRTAIFVLLLFMSTLGAAIIAAKPLKAAVEKLTQELSDKGFNAPGNTLTQGPDELRNFQASYRRARRRLQSKQAEIEAINENLAELVESRSRALLRQEILFQHVFNETTDGFMLLRLDGSVEEKNKATDALIPVTAQPAFIRAVADHLKVSSGAMRWTSEKIGKEKNEPLVLECRFFPVNGISNPPLKCCIAIQNITARDEVEQMKNSLVSIVAHELKTPLASLSLQFESLGTDGKLDTKDERVSGIIEDIRHLNHIINDWLSVANIESGAYVVTPSFIQLEPLVRRAARFVHAKYDFDFSVLIAEDAECIWADGTAVTEVFVNLFTNACRYSKEEEKPKIVFRAERCGNEIVLYIEDAGIGISANDGSRIFDRFFQVSRGSRRKTGGTGLGLVICRAICEAHGGRIEVSSTPEPVSDAMRTRFTITLPQPTYDPQATA